MKKFLALLILPILLFFLAPQSLNAQEVQKSAQGGVSSSSILPPSDSVPGFLGQDHHYSVTFRGNGEAVITARIVVANNGESPLSSINLRVPRIDPKDVIAFQVIRERQCLRYKPAELRQTYTPPICDTYQEPDYFQYWYGNAKYQKASVDLHGDTIAVTLPQPVKPSSSGSFILYYRGLGYAKKNLFGSFNFTFETLKVEDRIQTLQVGITTDSDLVLRGAKGKVNYRFDEGTTALKSAGALALPSANAQIDRFAQNIGQGEIIKNATNLQPLDSYSVKGSYAENLVRLYAKEIVITVFVIVAIAAVLILIGKSFLKRVQQPAKTAPQSDRMIDIISVVGLPFIAAFLMVAYTVLLVFVNNLFGLSSYGTGFIFAILIMLISFGVYGLLLITPTLIMGFKRGLVWGLATFGMTIFWLIADGIIIFMIILLLGNSNSPPYPIPYMRDILGVPSTQVQSTSPNVTK